MNDCRASKIICKYTVKSKKLLVIHLEYVIICVFFREYSAEIILATFFAYAKRQFLTVIFIQYKYHQSIPNITSIEKLSHSLIVFKMFFL